MFHRANPSLWVAVTDGEGHDAIETRLPTTTHSRARDDTSGLAPFGQPRCFNADST